MQKSNSAVRSAKVLAFALLSFLCLASEIHAQTGFDYLAQQLAHGNSEQKRNALFEIRNLKTEEASRLAIPALRDSEEIVRASAAASVVFLPSGETVSVLAPLLRDKKFFVRKEAAYALGQTRNPAAVQLLVETIQKDKIQEVIDAATVALGENGDVSAISGLIQILQRQPKEKEEFMRRAAARSLGQIAANQFLQNQIQLSNSVNANLNEKDNRANLSQQIPDFQNAVRLLIQILQARTETGDVKREAAFALGEIGDVSAIPVLQSNLRAEDYYLAENCRRALLKIGNSSN